MDADVCTRIAAALADPGWIVVPQFLSIDEARALAAEAMRHYGAGAFREAAVGHGGGRAVRADIRGDRIRWLDPLDALPAERAFLDRLETLRLALNRELFLGLFEVESHFALYPPGASYAAHLDQFAGGPVRRVSVTTYLNEAWGESDGGELRLYLDPEPGARYVDVLPRAGTLAAFLSDRFPHEVLPSRRDRLSVTNWFRTRA